MFTLPVKMTLSSSDECSDVGVGADIGDTGGGNLNLGNWRASSMSNAGLSLGRCWRRTTVQTFVGERILLGDCLSIRMLGAVGDEARLGGIASSLDGETWVTLDQEDSELIIAVLTQWLIVHTMTDCLILKLDCNGLFISCLIGIASPRRIG